ncbi:phospholipase D gamma 1-like isoform X2 [Raphanus sativus]|uniref:Phospholipase D n=1 Tax=Raphanus sativus TaxID=3726 RepID=A0A9W3DBI9_RAPSA|nr:phospholipase D gamma 1-like isoform X2 [Raphanus sativus]
MSMEGSSTWSSVRGELLHGNLEICVKEAKNLPNMDRFRMYKRNSTSDPFVSVSIAGAKIGTTFVIDNNENPLWMQHFYVPVAHTAMEVKFVVKDSDKFGAKFIGEVGIPTEELCSGNKIEGLFPILNSSGKPCKKGAVLSLSIQYTPVEMMKVYQMGVGNECGGVPGTYFPLRKGGRVTLYQDAHVEDGTLPSVDLDGGIQYIHGKCWEDMADAIRQARRLIYITGWSVYHPVRLVRRNNDPTDGTLGDLLKARSKEGVRVLLLVWNDPSSWSLPKYIKQGVMNTSDEETRHFFKNSSVQVIICPRSGGEGHHSFVKKQEVETIYTHHQKTVIVDADAGQGRRKIVGFVGGLDMCNGRFDTPNHPLFTTLKTLHKDDVHSPNFVPNADGPRQPWHDLHSKIDGPAAYDLLINFEQRWEKALKKQHKIWKHRSCSDDALLKINMIPEIMGLSEVSSTNDSDPESWHVQVFRSIDSTSVKGFPKDPKEDSGRNLRCGKNILIDVSIHTAYVKAIRSAQHFIYIENQYFFGSSFNWGSHKDLGANNLIPMEIALKIASKIRAREKFAAYIVIPMWPEGDPTHMFLQSILYWQYKTMQMMYQTIYTALVEAELDDQYEPQDYLNFFCLGTREAADVTVSKHSSRNQPTKNVQALKSRRFMIYVHSKGMVVDDEFVLIGSANINQRSLEGTRDTEIAMGGYQLHHSWAKKGSRPRGQIFGYRMSLWAEHLGFLEQGFEEPENMECVRRVRHLSELNWRQYAAEKVTVMTSHLLKYPVQVDRTGKVSYLPGCKTFHDVGGKIIGHVLWAGMKPHHLEITL